jgi:hypothetical protein
VLPRPRRDRYDLVLQQRPLGSGHRARHGRIPRDLPALPVVPLARTEAPLRPLHVLGEIRLLGGVLGDGDHRGQHPLPRADQTREGSLLGAGFDGSAAARPLGPGSRPSSPASFRAPPSTSPCSSTAKRHCRPSGSSS